MPKVFCLGLQVVATVSRYLVVVRVVGQQDDTHSRMALAAEDGVSWNLEFHQRLSGTISLPL